MRSRLRPHAAAAGFTLIEIAIASAILLLALLLANGLLVESLRILTTSARELREPDVSLALRLLREDVRSSSPLPGPFTTGGTDIDCRQSTRTVRWQLDGDRLERRLFDADGNDLGARPMLDGVVDFHWQALGPTLVEITLVRQRSRTRGAIAASTARWRDIDTRLESSTLVIGSRLGSGGSG